MYDIKDVSDEELRDEVERRKVAQEEERKPKQLAVIDDSTLRESCQEYIDSVGENEDRDCNLENFVFEAALEAVFGKQVWKWFNESLETRVWIEVE